MKNTIKQALKQIVEFLKELPAASSYAIHR